MGDDREGRLLVERFGADGVATAAVVRREATRTALIVDIVCGGEYRYLEDVPGGTWVTQADIRAASAMSAGADAGVVAALRGHPPRSAAHLATEASGRAVRHPAAGPTSPGPV